MNKQPFHHQMSLLFTATEDLSEDLADPKFIKALAKFLEDKFEVGVILKESVEYYELPSAEAGDPGDLM